jgi:hypothetical protein
MHTYTQARSTDLHKRLEVDIAGWKGEEMRFLYVCVCIHTYIHTHTQASSTDLHKRLEVDLAGWKSEGMRLEKQISDAQRAKASSSGSMASLQQENSRLKSEVCVCV